MLILQIIIYIVGALAIILTLLPFLKFGMWWIRIGEFPRLQIAFGSLIAALAAVTLFDYPLQNLEIALIIALIVCAVYQLFCVLPYMPVYPKQVLMTD